MESERMREGGRNSMREGCMGGKERSRESKKVERRVGKNDNTKITDERVE
jgi:hypothetical protein